jgi:hypothetical protein
MMAAVADTVKRLVLQILGSIDFWWPECMSQSTVYAGEYCIEN